MPAAYSAPGAARPRPQLPTAVPGDAKLCGDILNGMANELEGDPNMKPLDQKKLPDVKQRLGDLNQKLASGALSPNALSLLTSLCQALRDGNLLAAKQAHTKLVTDEFKDNQKWLPGVNTLLSMAKKR